MKTDVSPFFQYALLSRLAKGDLSVLTKYAEILDWGVVSKGIKMPGLSALVDARPELVDWEAVSRRVDLPIRFVDRHKDNLNWREVTRNSVFDPESLRCFAEYIDWHMASSTQILCTDAMCQYADELDWASIVRCQHAPDDFWIANAHRFNPDDLHAFQKTSPKLRNALPPSEPKVHSTIDLMVELRPAVAPGRIRSAINWLVGRSPRLYVFAEGPGLSWVDLSDAVIDYEPVSCRDGSIRARIRVDHQTMLDAGVDKVLCLRGPDNVPLKVAELDISPLHKQGVVPRYTLKIRVNEPSTAIFRMHVDKESITIRDPINSFGFTYMPFRNGWSVAKR